MQVSLSKHDNRTALVIESGYRKGNLMGDADGYVMHFSSDAHAIKWASETGYVVVFDESSTVTESEYNALLSRKCDLPKGCTIYSVQSDKKAN